MRFLAVALVVVAVATCCLANAEVAELEKMAQALRAPFTLKALEVMGQEGHWGVKRANRSSDVVVFNASNQPFNLTKAHCIQGKLSESLNPVDELCGRTSIVYGVESTTYLRDIQCTVLYESSVNTDTWFSLMIHTPFFGDNVAYPYSSGDIKITRDAGPGDNNQVLFTIKDNFSFGSLRSSQTGGLSLKMSKRNRNKFYRTSKSRSRSRSSHY